MVSLAFGLVGGGCNGNVTDKNIVWMTPNEIHRRMDGQTLVLDMRDGNAFAAGHVPGARLTKLAEVDERSDRLRFPGHSMIVVYGQNPGSAAAPAMAKRLMITKHDKVRAMEGGFDAWVAAGLPVESSPKPTE